MSAALKWYAAGGGIARTGPFPTQIDAYEALRLTDDARERQRRRHGVDMPYPHDIRVWPERSTRTEAA